MVIASHHIMSKHIFDSIMKNTSIRLNKARFTLGNMSPDLPLYHSHLKHYKNQNYGYVLDMIAELLDTDPRDSGAQKYYSYKLGVVCHYMCDYFCLPHHNRAYFHDKLGQHLRYEFDLHDQIKAFDSADYIADLTIAQLRDEADAQPLDFITLIERYHARYMQEQPSFMMDARYAISITSLLASVIVLASVGELDAQALSYEAFYPRFAEVFA